MQNPEVIIIGAGTNGLAAAVALSKAGMDTLVLEKRAVSGGLSAYHRFGTKYRIPGLRPYPDGSTDMLNKALGITFPQPTSANSTGLWNGDSFNIETVPELANAGKALKTLLSIPLKRASLRNKMAWLPTLLQTQTKDLARWIPLSCVDLLSEFDLCEKQYSALTAPLYTRTFAGPKSPFGALQMLLHANRNNSNGHAVLIQKLEAAARSNGAVIQTGAPVKQICRNSSRVHVLMQDKTPIYARFILATCSPAMLRNHLLNPVLISRWPPVRSRGTCAVLALAMDQLPGWLTSSRVRIVPDLMTQERAFDCVKYGKIPPQQTLEITACNTHNTLTIYALQTPSLTNNQWGKSARAALIEQILGQLPDLNGKILAQQLWTPVDIAEEFGVPGGHVLHFERDLDQLLFPAPDCLPPGVYWSGHFANQESGQIGAAGLGAARMLLQKRNHRPRFS